MAKRPPTGKGTAKKPKKKPIVAYGHADKKRTNNPPVGLVTPATDPDAPDKKTYEYDPHLDPQLVWAGKAEHTSFEVPTVSLHVHERIDPRTIIQAVRKANGNGGRPARRGDPAKGASGLQIPMFEQPAENPPLREAIEFYKHPKGWTNRLIAGDSLLVMNSLLEKEGMAGKVQMAYIDPPYAIKYGSNFQPFVNQRTVSQSDRDEDLTQEPEMIRAFRDTWEVRIHSYLTYMRDRLLLARELLNESGSCFVQISDVNLHFVRNLLDEVFGARNLIAVIPFRKKTMPLGTVFLEQMSDFILWYAKCARGDSGTTVAKYRRLYYGRSVEGEFHHCWYELNDGSRHRMSKHQLYNHALLPPNARVYRLKSLEPSGPMRSGMFDYKFQGKLFSHPKNGWGTTTDGMDRLVAASRIQVEGNRLTFILYADESDVTQLTAPWNDTVGADDKSYVVQTNTAVIRRCMLMTTDPGDLVLDPTCGSGTTAHVAEQWGRRWITCDTSRVALTLAKQRVMTSLYDFYELAHPNEGVGSGFNYNTVPHVTLKSIANNPEIRKGMSREEIDAAILRHTKQETLYDQPKIDKTRARVSGPFTVEAVPAPVMQNVAEASRHLMDQTGAVSADSSVARSGESLRQDEWRDELLKCGIRGKSGQRIMFSRIEPMAGTRWLHADAEATGDSPERVAISFGPQHAPLEQRQVECALQEAQLLKPKPKIVVFASFHFDPEAAKDIDETNWPDTTLLKVQMNTDLLTDDLKRKRSSNESFWMIGQPDVSVRQIHRGADTGKWEVQVHGFDYYNTLTGAIESGDTTKIAMWMLDTNYDGRSLYPRQVFFPLAGDKGGWDRLARNLKDEIDGDLIEAYRGSVSLPFNVGEWSRLAVKILDDRGIECLKIITLE